MCSSSRVEEGRSRPGGCLHGSGWWWPPGRAQAGHNQHSTTKTNQLNQLSQTQPQTQHNHYHLKRTSTTQPRPEATTKTNQNKQTESKTIQNNQHNQLKATITMHQHYNQYMKTKHNPKQLDPPAFTASTTTTELRSTIARSIVQHKV